MRRVDEGNLAKALLAARQRAAAFKDNDMDAAAACDADVARLLTYGDLATLAKAYRLCKRVAQACPALPEAADFERPLKIYREMQELVGGASE